MSKLILANWKMNPGTLMEAENLLKKTEEGIEKTKDKEVVVCPPFIYLSAIGNKLSKINLGAQNCHWREKGAYTGEISAKMLKCLGVKYVIVGHSERRNYFQETNRTINRKIKSALKAGLIPILCTGEKRGENSEEIINNQLEGGIEKMPEKDLKKIIIAYEPVWAIGSGEFCPPEKAEKAKEFIKEKLSNKVLYGGSVNSEIVGNYTKTGFDGVLVGGASLEAGEFIKLINNA